MPPSTLGAFAKSDTALASADLEWHVQPLSLAKFGEPLHPFGAITPSVCNLRPSSRGHVRIAGADPLTHPKISCNYLSTDADRDVAVRGLRMTRKIMAAPSWLLPPEEMLPGRNCRATTTCSKRPVSWGPPSSIRWAPARWERSTPTVGRDRPPRCSTPTAACTASPGSGSSMLQRCPPSPLATPTRRSC